MKRALILAFRATLVLICLCLAHAAEPTEIADAQLPSGVNLDWEKASITAVNTKRVQIEGADQPERHLALRARIRRIIRTTEG